MEEQKTFGVNLSKSNRKNAKFVEKWKKIMNFVEKARRNVIHYVGDYAKNYSQIIED